MYYSKKSSILNAVVERTSEQMMSTIYQNTLSNISLQGVNRGYNIRNNSSGSKKSLKPIICGVSRCGSEAHPIDEYCRYS